MDIAKIIKSVTPLEKTLFVIFVLYLILPIQTPSLFYGVVDSPLGIIFMFVVALYLYFYANPILAIVFIFVAYEMIRRTSKTNTIAATIQYTPSEAKRAVEMVAMNPPKKESLEEQIVDKMAPIGHSDASVYSTSTFKPVAESVGSASAV